MFARSLKPEAATEKPSPARPGRRPTAAGALHTDYMRSVWRRSAEVAGARDVRQALPRAGSGSGLVLGARDDAHERAADDLADQAMAAGPSVSMCGGTCGGDCPTCQSKGAAGGDAGREVRAKAAGPGSGGASHTGGEPAPPGVERALASPSAPLDAAARARFEPRFGRSFGDVRVHTGGEASASAEDVGARAYTVGSDIVFGPGHYEPATETGQRLLAHELAHVAMRGPEGGPAVVRRDNGKDEKKDQKKDEKKEKKPKPGKAKDAPSLDLQPLKDKPCACLVFIHNNEKNAREMAKLLHEHCSYNLAIISGSAGRKILLPGALEGEEVDPNSLFEADTAKECLEDEAGCRQFLVDNAKSTDKKTIAKYAQIQFFLAIYDCSKGFEIPIVALHNNDLEETQPYHTKRGTLSAADQAKLDADLKGTLVEGVAGPGGKDPEDELRQKLESGLKDTSGAAMDTARKTNIFRWCNFAAVDELSKCHVGDPAHPDHVVWVTNEKDFDRLAKQDINVAYQGEIPTSAKSESKGDLSTLFLILRQIYEGQMAAAGKVTAEQIQQDSEKIKVILDTLEELKKYNDATPEQIDASHGQVIDLLLQMIAKLLALLDLLAAKAASIGKLRYINIETPSERVAGGKRTSLDAASRTENLDFVLKVLQAAGLHCCDTDAEKKVREGLEPKKEEERK